MLLIYDCIAHVLCSTVVVVSVLFVCYSKLASHFYRFQYHRTKFTALTVWSAAHFIKKKLSNNLQFNWAEFVSGVLWKLPLERYWICSISSLPHCGEPYCFGGMCYFHVSQSHFCVNAWREELWYGLFLCNFSDVTLFLCYFSDVTNNNVNVFAFWSKSNFEVTCWHRVPGVLLT